MVPQPHEIWNIKTIDDVKEFIRDLIEAEINFHVDTPFADYVNTETGERTFTDKDVQTLNNVLKDCFTVCSETGIDIYAIALEESRILSTQNAK